MKQNSVITIVLSLLVIAMVACKDKKLEILTPSIKLTKEKVMPLANGVRIEGTFESDVDLISMEISIALRENMLDAICYPVQIDENDFLVEIDSLAQGVTYYYCYSAFYGSYSEYKTPVSSFTTTTSTPSVSILDVAKVDNHTYRIKCEVTSDGGVTMTERGICWNTYGDPHIDDEIELDGDVGVGEYTCRMSDLAADTRYYVRAYAKNTLGTGYSAEVEFGTGDAVTIPTVVTNTVTEITKTTALVGGNVTNTGGSTVIERGICWSMTNPDPVLDEDYISIGNGLGVFSTVLTNLTPNTRYYVRTYAINRIGVSYGGSKSFVTLPDYNLPEVTTNDVYDITYNTAVCGGMVTNEGGTPVTERGICWSSTNQNPTIEDSYVTSGAGSGSFYATMTDLDHITHYYVRAYAVNVMGISYGEVVEFTTDINKWLSYDDGTWYKGVGVTNGGTIKWANRFTADILAPYDGYSVEKVKVYIKYTGHYILQLYSGGVTQPSNQLASGEFDINETGWQEMELSASVAINVNQPLWVVMTYNHEAGQNPASASKGNANADSRWVFLNGRWCDVTTYGMNDLCWMIRAYVTNGQDKYWVSK